MTAPHLAAELRALRLRQGQAWVERAADLEGWPKDRRMNAFAELACASGPALDALVEHHRAYLSHLLDAHSLRPAYGGASDPRRHGTLPDTPPPARKRGIARALKPKVNDPATRQRDLFGDAP
ncbi:hypothetical protein RN01_11760 [Cupriavidus sp. SHE]|jgi:hypothetical protein|uniref:Uncharacterized protein n=1 Tax=Cupriavidus metallidurans TaxID=119219 RepID=A0A482IML2_9BURK|nr:MULTISPECIES: hypothetical protein [Cupriavidus]KWR82804.1 hypothetical protein RN01_11760 [Cupriavidus sp. SHE]QBP09196.1 hypothetical protein DDF84_005175 [Cupriavidus metallidurans]